MFNPVFNKSFGEKVVVLRKKAGVSQAALAKSLSFTAQFLGRVEKGKTPMPKAAFRKTVKLLKIPLTTIEAMASLSAKEYAKEILTEGQKRS